MAEKKVAPEKKSAEKKVIAEKKPTNGKGVVKRGPSGDSIGKTELTAMVAKDLDFAFAPTKAVIDAFLLTIVTQVKKSKTVVIPGLFRAQIVNRKARMSRNPKTGETFKVPARKAIKLRKASSFNLK